MTDHPRLIEFAFPLKQASLDSVHEKNVRHGHISTLHIWPARRPLAACRAALIATLLPDPGTPEGRRKLCEKIAGKVVKKIEKKKMPGGQIVEREKEETEGGILHWGRETENAETLEWFRQEIRKAYGGRAPKVLDPFAGGGAIPLEAMRLGCEATAMEINPVAWFILKCTLEYPQKLAGKTYPLPPFVLKNREFMHSYFKAQGMSNAEIAKQFKNLRLGDAVGQGTFLPAQFQAHLAWHVRAWGQWVLGQARQELARFYPLYAEFKPLQEGKAYERQQVRLVPLREDGRPDMDSLNAEFGEDYLRVKTNPRWIAKPTVAYLWARTVTCQNCRATIPLLKSLWLCKKQNKRVLLTIEPNPDKSGVVFRTVAKVPIKGSNPAQRRENDKRLGSGTMSRAGAKCPCCPAIMTMEDIRVCGQAKELAEMVTAVVIDGPEGKEYRLPTDHECAMAAGAAEHIDRVFAEVPFGVPEEPTPAGGGRGAGRAFSVKSYGLMKWRDLFTSRQLVALGTFLRETRAAREAIADAGYAPEWTDGIVAFLACGLDRLADRSSTLCRPDPTPTQSGVINTFSRFALPITWDFIEGNTLLLSSGGYLHSLEWVAKYVEHAADHQLFPEPNVIRGSVLRRALGLHDLIITDPPYYDAIPYSDLMDFFYIWLRRTLGGLSSEIDDAFCEPLAPKWNGEENDGELIDDESRHGGDAQKSKAVYEHGMARAFEACHASLKDEGRLVIVFANKQPGAWETLASALIRAGFVVNGSWPIQTEMGNRVRALSSAAFASSVWLVCRKRGPDARVGWDNKVLEGMRARISRQFRDFWDADIKGPNLVWAATGPALEAYSKHPVVKKADDPGQILTVSEFLSHVRRMVVDFIVGRVLPSDTVAETAVDRLDEPTAYYLLHRHDFGLEEAPVGACILYATACGLSDQALARDWEMLVKTGSDQAANSEEIDQEADDDKEPAEDTGSGGEG
jgi:putative DNA methylase